MKGLLMSSKKVTISLLSAIAVIFLVWVLLWVLIEPEPLRNPYLNVGSLPSEQLQPVSDIETVLARPLFWRGRQPGSEAEKDAADPSVVAEALKDIKLLGIVFTDDVGTAILNAEGEIISVRVGQVVKEWTVKEIAAQKIIFVAGAKQTVLSLVRERPESIFLEAVQ